LPARCPSPYGGVVSGHFVGRTSEIAQLAALLAISDGPSAAIILGDPGVGKSRLLAETAQARGLATFTVTGYEPERLVPLAAASDLLRALASLPERGDLVDELVFRSLSPAEPVRIFEAAHRAVAAGGDVLLVVDDLQWVDELSLALVHYLLRGAAGEGVPLRLLAAGRGVDRSLRFADEAARLLSPSNSVTLDLAPLDTAESVELARLLDPKLSTREAERFCERAAGIPFWIETLVRSGATSAGTAELLSRRLRGARVDDGALLAVLAVLARPLRLHDAADLLGWPHERLLAAGESLVARGVASRSANELRTAHDLFRDAATESLAPRRRRELHRHIASWLERSAEDDVALLREALEHCAAAGERPARLALRLVSAPHRRWLGRPGLTILAKVAVTADTDGPALQRGVASLASELGEHRLALERWTACVPLADSRQHRFEALLEAARAAFGLGWTYTSRSHDLVREALAIAETEPELVAAQVLEARILLWLDHLTPEGAAAARSALERSRRLGVGDDDGDVADARRVRLDALRTAAHAAKQEGDGEEVLRLGEEMVAVTHGDDAYVDALLVYAEGQYKTGPLGEAIASARSALAIATERALPAQAADAALFLAAALYDYGELDEAGRVEALAAELAHRVANVKPQRMIGHELRLVRGGPERGVEDYLAALDDLRDPHVRIKPLYIAATFLSRTRGPSQRRDVVALLERAKADAVAAACPGCANSLHGYAAAALARVGSHEDAGAELARADEWQQRGAAYAYQRDYARALVRAKQDPRAGSELLEKVCTEAERLERRLETLWVRVELARLTGADDRRGAAEILRACARDSDALGATVIGLVAERELRRLGVRTWRRSATMTGGSLSDREREVASLVAGGATNPEIAQTLFVSRKTVERHVSNVLAKLGARNRAELASLLAHGPEGDAR
jgi:DNA-binding CsgD family transcriptional regulator